MTIGTIAYLVSAILFFLSGIKVSTGVDLTTWGLFCIALGLLLDDYDMGFRRRR